MSSDDGAPRLNLLIAYPYFTKEVAADLAPHQDKIRLLIDSGAFTAWKAGKPIALDSYCRFLETMPIKPWRYFTLDVIGDAVGTLRNYDEMHRRGFKPVPIFTRGADTADIARYYKTSDVVGIGGLVRTQRNRAFVNGAMKIIGRRRVHWLGFTDIPFLKHYRPYSCDASGWDQSPYGSVRLYMGSGSFVYIHQKQKGGNKLVANAPLPPAVVNRIAFYGVDPLALRHRDGWHGDGRRTRVATRICHRSMVHAALDIETNLGTKYFFATGRDNIRSLIESWERLK